MIQIKKIIILKIIINTINHIRKLIQKYKFIHLVTIIYIYMKIQKVIKKINFTFLIMNKISLILLLSINILYLFIF